MSDLELWTMIAIPTAAVSAFGSYFLLKWFRPVIKRQLLWGTLINILMLGGIIGLGFVCATASVVIVAIWFPLDFFWIWFMLQPRINKRTAEKEEYGKKLRGKK